jgi:hypothetical protein
MTRQRLNKTITGAYTVLITDNGTTLICNKSTAFTITLPSASGLPNFDLLIENIGEGIVTCNSQNIGQYSLSI